MDATPAHGLTALVIQNETLLRAIAVANASDEPAASAFRLAAATQRDESNVRKSVTALVTAGLVEREPWTRLTGQGRAVLDALDRAAAGGASTTGTPRLPWTAFVRDPDQPRKAFDPDDLADLARAIHAAEDILENLVVRPPDASGARMIAAGERRWRAVQLLADGAVEGCDLPAALDPARGGGLPYTERTAADAADALFVALVENGARVGLNPIEDGEALLAIMTARGWSAREAAHQLGRVGKKSGEPGAGSDGVKQVQERVKVAREATPENKARFLAGEITWKQLLETVQATRPGPTFHVLAPLVRYDIEAMGWALKGLSARIDLAVAPDGGWRSATNYSYPQSGGGSAVGWIEGRDEPILTRVEAFARAEASLRRVANEHRRPTELSLGVRLLQWLDALGDGTMDPADVPARKPTVREHEADRIARREGGAGSPRTSSANRPEPAAAVAGRPAYRPSSCMIVALAEVCHVHALAGRGETAFHPFADTHSYWLDAELGDAIAAGLVRMDHGADHAPRAVVLDAGRDALTAAVLEQTGGELEDWPADPDGSWSTMRLIYRTFAVPGALAEADQTYLTPWLNLPAQPDESHPSAPPAGAPPALDADLEDDRTVEDILGPLTLMNIVEAADPATGPAFLSGLFERVGFKGPFVASQARDEEGVVHDALGRAVVTCDQHGDETHDMALAQAIVVAAALNASLGLSVDIAPAKDAA